MVGVAVVIGVGPGLGLSIARRFAREKYTVAILSRDLGYPLPTSLSLFSLSDFVSLFFGLCSGFRVCYHPVQRFLVCCVRGPM
jgi:ribose/xylose/arabinose/galactoside ABC-type transport system permease subunit